MPEEIQQDVQELSPSEKEELEALRAASRRNVLVKDFSSSFAALAPTAITLINQLASATSQWNTEQGFWECENFGEKVALIHSELSEALEAHRKDDQSGHLPGFHGVEEELADAMIRILDLAGKYNCRLGEALFSKLQFNLTRPYKHGKAY